MKATLVLLLLCLIATVTSASDWPPAQPLCRFDGGHWVLGVHLEQSGVLEVRSATVSFIIADYQSNTLVFFKMPPASYYDVSSRGEVWWAQIIDVWQLPLCRRYARFLGVANE